MSNYLIHNGELKPAQEAVLTADNRAFSLGDGIFETIRVLNGKPCYLEAHYTRFCQSLAVLSMEKPVGLTREVLYDKIISLAQQNELRSGRCRLTIYRNTGGVYLPTDNSSGYVITLDEMSENKYILNDIGDNTDIYPDMRKPVSKLAIHKTLNANFYILAALWAKEKGLSNCLIQNERGNIIEASNSNLFIVSNSVLYTPSLADGCLGGVMRAQVINVAIRRNIKVYECSLNPQNLLAADEVFLTNAISGIRWVSAYRTKKYVDRMSRELVEVLNEDVASSTMGLQGS